MNLLISRRSVSIETIMRECHVSSRTAYRYTDALSQANFPIVKDQARHGFMLLNKDDVRISNWTQDEAIQVVLGSLVFDSIMGSEMSTTTQRILARLEAFVPLRELRRLLFWRRLLPSPQSTTELKSLIELTLNTSSSEQDLASSRETGATSTLHTSILAEIPQADSQR